MKHKKTHKTTHKKILTGIILLLVSVSFAFLGIGDFTIGENAAAVARVDGHDITEVELDNAHMLNLDRLREQNPNLDFGALDSPAMRMNTLRQLMRDYVLVTAANREKLVVSDIALTHALQADPDIAALRDENGQFDMQAYQNLLASMGMSPESFEARLRNDLSRQQVLAGVFESQLVSQAQADTSLAALHEERGVRLARFKPEDYIEALQPDEQQLQDFYETHLQNWQAPETADVQYVVLDLDKVKQQVHISERELHDYYEQNAPMLGEAEQRKISHILFAVDAAASDEEREAVKNRAEGVLQQLQQNPAEFAALAREFSDDDFSAENGGDLGFFEKDEGIDPDISRAGFEIESVGDIGPLVQSEFGYHIIELTDIKKAEVPDFDTLRDELEDQLRTQEAQTQFSELSDEFTNTVYEQPDTLEPIAEKLGLELHTVKALQRHPAADAQGALASDSFLKSLFSSESIRNKNNTEAQETGPYQLASGRILEYVPAHSRPFEEVKEQVRQAWIDDNSRLLAREEGEKNLQAWIKNPNKATDLDEETRVSLADTSGQSSQLIEAIMRVDPEQLPAFVGMDLGAQGYTIASVERVLPVQESNDTVEQDNMEIYEPMWTNAELISFYDHLQKKYKAKILMATPEAENPGS